MAGVVAVQSLIVHERNYYRKIPFNYRNVRVIVVIPQHLALARETPLLLSPPLSLVELPDHLCFQICPGSRIPVLGRVVFGGCSSVL